MKQRGAMAAVFAAMTCLVGASGAAGAAPAAFHASRVVGYSPGAGYTLFPDPLLSLGGPYGSPAGSLHVVTLGVQGRLTLGFEPGAALTDGAGADLIVFENPVHGGAVVFAELVRVGVSTDGADYAWYPTRCTVAGPMAAYEYMDPADVDGFAGVGPVWANVADNSIDPFDPAAAGGDAFDLADLADDPLVTAGVVDLSRIYYVRLVDVLGDGTELDSVGDPIYDPTGIMDPPYSQPTSADIDAVSVVHGLAAPTAGDANRDGAVDVFDLAVLANHYGAAGGAVWEDGDFTGDAAVNVFDLGVLANHYGHSAGVPVPAPGVAGLLLVGAVVTGRRRRLRN